MLLFLSLGCTGEEPEIDTSGPPIVEDTAVEPETIETIDAVRALTRLSLDLRGRRPTIAEIEAVQSDAQALDGLVEDFLQDAAFPDRMGWLWNTAFQTGVWGQSYERFGPLDAETWAAMGYEPIAIVAAVVDEDRPFTELVTLSGTRADEALIELYHLEGEGGWGPAAYTDGRPDAGVLAVNALWLRHTADTVNQNRVRANAVARIFLCADFLDREDGFAFEIDPSEPNAVETAVRNDPACLGCHAALDPLTGFFGGFPERSDQLPIERYIQYSPYMEQWLAQRRSVAYYGQEASTLADLGKLIGADPRFARCSVRRFYEGLVGETPTAAAERELVEGWVEGGMDARSLVASIVARDEYLKDETRDMVPRVLYTTIADLLDWSTDVAPDEGLAPMGWDAELRVMAGSTDDWTVVERNSGPHLGMQALTLWAARRTAGSAEGILDVEADTTSEAEISAELARLHLRFFGREATSQDLEALQELHAAGGFDLVVAGLIRHPRMLVY